MKPKTWNNSEWWFCGKKTGGKYEQQRQHKGKDCQGKAYFYNQKRKPDDDGNKEPKDAPPKTKIKKEKEPRKPTKALKLANALSNIVNDDDDNTDSEG